jgi:hypothetical protein
MYSSTLHDTRVWQLTWRDVFDSLISTFVSLTKLTLISANERMSYESKTIFHL